MRKLFPGERLPGAPLPPALSLQRNVLHERDVKTVFTKTTKSDKSLIDENR